MNAQRFHVVRIYSDGYSLMRSFAKPCFTGSLSACLDFIRHYMRGGATGFSIVPVQS